MAVLVATSGWQYRDWRGRLYPAGLAQAKWLQYYAARFATVELNSTFYRLFERETFVRWAGRTPEDFVFSIKASRYLSHTRLRDPREPVARFMERAGGLGGKLGPVLVQLRDTFKADMAVLGELLDSFPSGTKVAFEPRHESWYTEATADLLARHGACFCLTDSPRRSSPLWRTTSWGYLRFHEGRGSPRPSYSARALRRWAEILAERWSPTDDVYAYFNNDRGGAAVRDARRFASEVASVGLEPSRVPKPAETPLEASRTRGAGISVRRPKHVTRSRREASPRPSN